MKGFIPGCGTCSQKVVTQVSVLYPVLLSFGFDLSLLLYFLLHMLSTFRTDAFKLVYLTSNNWRIFVYFFYFPVLAKLLWISFIEYRSVTSRKFYF